MIDRNIPNNFKLFLSYCLYLQFEKNEKSLLILPKKRVIILKNLKGEYSVEVFYFWFSDIWDGWIACLWLCQRSEL